MELVTDWFTNIRGWIMHDLDEYMLSIFKGKRFEGLELQQR